MLSARSRTGAAIRVAWRPASEATLQRHAACASYEVQAAPLAGGQALRQTCSARVQECTLCQAEPGAAYQVLDSELSLALCAQPLRSRMQGCMQRIIGRNGILAPARSDFVLQFPELTRC
jgi:hypothetical protein